MFLKSADVVVGLVYGDEGKGKVTAALAGSGKYDSVARWAGGNNAGHTVYVNGVKYATHLIPSGVFYGVKSVIGPGCVLHPESFFGELEKLEKSGFDTSLVRVAPNCHIVQDKHIIYDKENLASKLGTTSKGIAPAYAEKMARTGILAHEIKELEGHIWDGYLGESVLCEGAQGVWLDVDAGNYPYVTSSTTLPYAACSLGFAPQRINRVFGVAKAYDTRSGEDPLFPESLFDDPLLDKLGRLGSEFGVTTGRRRKVNWLNLDLLLKSVDMTGTTDVIINKCDILGELGIYRVFWEGQLVTVGNSTSDFEKFVKKILMDYTDLVETVKFSYSPEDI